MNRQTLSEEQIIAMAVSAIAEQTGNDIERIVVKSFHKVSESSLQKYLRDSNTEFEKYKLEKVL